jgi:acyl-coenzyme A synthetase/AMP-(fatty) acid ligase
MIESLHQAGDRSVVRCDGVGTTGGALLDAIYRYARALESLGVARGDLVAIYAPNRTEALAVRYATHLLGAASVYLSAPPDPDKRARMLVDFSPRRSWCSPTPRTCCRPPPRRSRRSDPLRRCRCASTRDDGHLHIHGRVVDCAEVDGRLVSPTALQELLCGRPDVRYAVIVLDPETGRRIAAVLPWPGHTIDTTACLDRITEVFAPSVASTIVVLPMDRIPLTEQGKPNRPEIRRLGRERAHAAVSASGLTSCPP